MRLRLPHCSPATAPLTVRDLPDTKPLSRGKDLESPFACNATVIPLQVSGMLAMVPIVSILVMVLCWEGIRLHQLWRNGKLLRTHIHTTKLDSMVKPPKTNFNPCFFSQ